MEFLLEALGYSDLTEIEKYSNYDKETCVAMMEEAGKFCKNEVLPLNRPADLEGVSLDPTTGAVTVPESFKTLYNKFVEGGYIGMIQPEEFGGYGAPHILGSAFGEMLTATNKSFSMCPGLTNGLIDALIHYGTDEQKAFYLPNMVSGKWSGTMCLTEPHCGTDLGMLKTKAIPEGDHYRLSGSKIWITFGEHDLTENIIHLVLARLPDAPEGIKGISAFIVPKFNPDGERNSISCGGLEHKMGIHASPTCVMNMDEAKGWLVGDPHKGMRTMFVMMNAARLQVGMEGLALSEIAYQTAVAFAKDRRQMRSLDPAKRDMDAPADCIIVHPDVRRMLLNIKSTNEGMRALGYWVAKLIDLAEHHPDEAERQRYDDIVALLTPIVKSYFTERGFQNISDAMQVMGGAGYTQDWPVELYMRDARIAMIYEGTNHIQALDLIGRKLPKDGGRLVRTFAELVTNMIRENADNEAMQEFIGPLKNASKKLTEITMALGAKGMQDAEEAGAAASNYLNIFALTSLAYIWCMQVQTALTMDSSLARTKVKTARYFMHQILPEIDSLAAIIEKGKANMMAFEESEF